MIKYPKSWNVFPELKSCYNFASHCKIYWHQSLVKFVKYFTSSSFPPPPLQKTPKLYKPTKITKNKKQNYYYLLLSSKRLLLVTYVLTSQEVLIDYMFSPHHRHSCKFMKIGKQKCFTFKNTSQEQKNFSKIINYYCHKTCNFKNTTFL